MVLEDLRAKPLKQGSKVVVVGAGRSGMAAVRLLVRQKMRVRLLEKDPARIHADFRVEAEAAGVDIVCGEHTSGHFVGADYVIPSPGMPLAVLLPLLPTSGGPEVLAEMELAWRFLSGEAVLAITGTSGKTTTASLAAAMLGAQGFSVFLGGNIGTPLSEYVLGGRKADVVVVEISSFQLQTCSTFCPKVGVLLNISENHLDYHADMKEYISAKFRLFRCQEEDDIAVFGQELAPLVKVMHVKARQVWIGDTERFSQSQLFGKHNRTNMEAAWLACREFGVREENAAKAVAAFKPLPHRLEKVAEKNQVLYVNDSKCTTVSSLKVALEAFDRPVVLLCGGKFKGGDLAGLRDLVLQHVKRVALFGASREHFEQAWENLVPMSWDANLEQAVHRIHSACAAGDVLLLAPATSSFDLYANYRERGNDFKRIVGSL
ncbi:MAG: UDP-N-acetylmuramoyl-L-alanine--D-glutamate ligase [Desulfovibrionaceae bacterium]